MRAEIDFPGYGPVGFGLCEVRKDFMPNTMRSPPLKLGLAVMNIQRRCCLIEDASINLSKRGTSVRMRLFS